MSWNLFDRGVVLVGRGGEKFVWERGKKNDT
jgi:hypothetical protein